MRSKKNNNLDEGVNESDFSSEEFELGMKNKSIITKLRHFFFTIILFVSLFLCSLIVVWYASTDSQRAQTNLFIQQALQGNIDFLILQQTKFQSLGNFQWPWKNENKLLDEKFINKQITSPAPMGIVHVSSSEKYQNLYSCNSPSKFKLKMKKLYKWKDPDGQLHMY